MLIKIKKKFFSQKNIITIRDSLKLAMVEEMHRDKSVFLMGEEVGEYQGAYKISKGMIDIFGHKRVIDTPITEMGFTGLACGSAFMDTRPILEFMTWNFALQGICQIINSAAKTLYMSAGDIHCPIVFRGLNGPAASVAAQHSQCLASMLSNIPGLKVVAPYDAYDCKFLLKASIRDNNPVCFLENELMYSREFEVGEDFYDEENVYEIGKAKIMREGTDCTVVAFSRMVGEALKAADVLEKEGVSVEVINLRTIRPLDRESIINSVKKTNRLVTIEDGYPTCGIGAEIISCVMESPAFDFLDAPARRVTSWDIPLPYAKQMEQATLPQVDNIVRAVRGTLEGVKL